MHKLTHFEGRMKTIQSKRTTHAIQMPPKIARYCKKWEKERKFDQPAIRMTGKAVAFKKDKDENEEEEWPAIFEDIYYKRMQQLEAHHDRKKRQELETKEFSLD